MKGRLAKKDKKHQLWNWEDERQQYKANAVEKTRRRNKKPQKNQNKNVIGETSQRGAEQWESEGKIEDIRKKIQETQRQPNALYLHVKEPKQAKMANYFAESFFIL